MKTKTTESFQSFFDKSHRSLVYWEERAILDFTEKMLARLESDGVSKSALAERLNVSLPYVTKLIGGSNNFTLRTMVKVARSLGARINFEFKDDVAEGWLQYRAATAPSVTATVGMRHLPDFANMQIIATDNTAKIFARGQKQTESSKYEELASAA